MTFTPLDKFTYKNIILLMILKKIR